MKLKVRIDLSPGPPVGRAWLGSLITKGCFRISAPQGENGFVTGENCFVAPPATKHCGKKSNDFRNADRSHLHRRPVAERAGPAAEPAGYLLWTTVNPIRFPNDLREWRATLWAVGALHPVRQQNLFVSTGIAVVGNGNNDVGSDAPRKTGKPIVEQMQGSGSSGAGTINQMQAGQPSNCGAMSQQGSFSYHGNVSSPQQLLHLVGCRDPRVRSEPQVRKAPQRR